MQRCTVSVQISLTPCRIRKQLVDTHQVLAELLQRTGHTVTQKQLDVWITEAEQANICDDRAREPEQKKRRLQRKFGKCNKATNNRTGRDCDEYYHSGGKSALKPIDLLQDEQDDEDIEHVPSDTATLKEFTTLGLKTIAKQLIQQVGGDVDARTKHIPSKGKGQKKAWLDLCMTLIKEKDLSKLHVPVSICRQKHQLVDAVHAHGVAVLSLHPTVWDVRVTFKDK